MEMYDNGWESDLRCRALRKVSTSSTLIFVPTPLFEFQVTFEDEGNRPCSSNMSPDSKFNLSRELLTSEWCSGQLTLMQKMAVF